MALPAQHDQIGRAFVAQSFVGVMVDFERRRGRANAALVTTLGQRLSAAHLPPLSFQILAIGQLRPRPSVLARGAHAQLTGQHGLSGGGVLTLERLAANVARAAN